VLASPRKMAWLNWNTICRMVTIRGDVLFLVLWPKVRKLQPVEIMVKHCSDVVCTCCCLQLAQRLQCRQVSLFWELENLLYNLYLRQSRKVVVETDAEFSIAVKRSGLQFLQELFFYIICYFHVCVFHSERNGTDSGWLCDSFLHVLCDDAVYTANACSPMLLEHFSLRYMIVFTATSWRLYTPDAKMWQHLFYCRQRYCSSGTGSLLNYQSIVFSSYRK